ncbi:MAG TPA: RodZ domain-containing protein [Streptosporangiaceae bacterium]|nr:RodZ domain-containing protein [Streptosporangiaceae bacterium]
MSIGEALAEARDQAGLSVDQVSEQTRIRPVIIRGIEAGDYSVCGGDFYARGHIRSIAQAVGADPAPLIEEYDEEHRATGPIAATGLDELVARSRPPERPRLNPVLLLAAAAVIVLGGAGYYLAFGRGHGPAAAPQAAASSPAAQGSAVAGHGVPGSARSGHAVVVRLTASRGTWVVFTTPAGGYLSRSYAAAGAAVTWTLHRAVHIKLSDPGAVRMTVNGKNALPAQPAAGPVTLSLGPGRPVTVAAPVPAPSPGASAPASAAPAASGLQNLTPVGITAFGAFGRPGDNPQNAGLATDGNPNTAWQSDWYTTPRFGHLYPGTGLILNMGHQVTVDKVRVRIGAAPGAHFQVRVGSARDLAGLPVVARSAGPGGIIRLRLASPAQGRYVLVWFTSLPPDAAGTFQVRVFNVVVRGHG